ncbi:transposase [Defluviitalea saccharophila]|uniref:Transposase n=1 Tax=Defluviitalea saccharophila TaxID=879970 RepID=A0ABZ2Y6A2_9FIRM
MYKCKTKSEAIEYYENWKKSIPKDLKEFRDIAKTIDRLKVEVFNYFDGRVTNAIVEGLNNLIREYDRIGRGYDFEILRAKALFCLNHKVEKPKYATNTFSHMMYDSFNFSNDLPKDYGVPIKEYIKALNAGLFD